MPTPATRPTTPLPEAQQAGPAPPAQRPRLLRWLAFSDRAAERLRWGARGWTSVRTPVFLMLAAQQGIPHSASAMFWEAPLQLSLLALVDIGTLVTWKFKATGATITTLGAVLLGVLATMEQHPLQGLLTALAFMLPGVLYWLDWQRTQPLRTVVRLAVALTVLMLIGGVAAVSIHIALNGTASIPLLHL